MKHYEIKRTHRYKFTQKELREKLGLVGSVTGSGLWRGLSPNEEKAGKSTDTTIWYIDTEENLEDIRDHYKRQLKHSQSE